MADYVTRHYRKTRGATDFSEGWGTVVQNLIGSGYVNILSQVIVVTFFSTIATCVVNSVLLLALLPSSWSLLGLILIGWQPVEHYRVDVRRKNHHDALEWNHSAFNSDVVGTDDPFGPKMLLGQSRILNLMLKYPFLATEWPAIISTAVLRNGNWTGKDFPYPASLKRQPVTQRVWHDYLHALITSHHTNSRRNLLEQTKPPAHRPTHAGNYRTPYVSVIDSVRWYKLTNHQHLSISSNPSNVYKVCVMHL